MFQGDLCMLPAVTPHPAYAAPVPSARALGLGLEKAQEMQNTALPMHFFQQLMKRGLLLKKARIL